MRFPNLLFEICQPIKPFFFFQGYINGLATAPDKLKSFINGANSKINKMENQLKSTETNLYRVHDEMAFEDILMTNNLNEAHACAYNYQAVLIDNLTNTVIKDYSCY